VSAAGAVASGFEPDTRRHRIRDVRSAIVRVGLDSPLRFGELVIRVREYVVVVVRAQNGEQGFGYSLTRDAPVAAIIDKLVAPGYAGRFLSDPGGCFDATQRRNPATLAAGAGLRALSVVDLATWDLAARIAGQSVIDFLGGRRARLPAIVVIGFPPTSTSEEVGRETQDLYKRGWRRFKLPIAATVEQTRDRLAAARDAAPDAELMLDAVWSWRNAEEAERYLRNLAALELAWVEDPFLPGSAAEVAALRRAVSVPVATGDEQGGPYFPEALLQVGAVDVLRADATCVGGVTRFRRLLESAAQAGVAVSPHIYPSLHAPLLCGLGATDALAEFGRRGNGVDPLSDLLWDPVLDDGFVKPPAADGFGFSLDPAWLREQDLDDPDGIFVAATT
jgi:L-alanine-DL-glutamate epimerase-like enolase superfamily enzyme